MQASHIVTLVQPCHRNFGKRLRKTPKLYLLDTGLLCYLLRVAGAADLQVHAARGAVFETWAMAETLKHRIHQGLSADLYSWRDNHGLEMGLVFEHRGRLHSVECTSGTTYADDWLLPARRWRHAVDVEAAPPVLMYGADLSHQRSDHWVLAWRDPGQRVN